jgi:hypothetical protein
MRRSGGDAPRLSDLRDVYKRLLQIEARVVAVQNKLADMSKELGTNAAYMNGMLEQHNLMVDILADIHTEVKKHPAPPPAPRRKPRSSRSKLQ